MRIALALAAALSLTGCELSTVHRYSCVLDTGDPLYLLEERFGLIARIYSGNAGSLRVESPKGGISQLVAIIKQSKSEMLVRDEGAAGALSRVSGQFGLLIPGKPFISAECTKARLLD